MFPYDLNNSAARNLALACETSCGVKIGAAEIMFINLRISLGRSSVVGGSVKVGGLGGFVEITSSCSAVALSQESFKWVPSVGLDFVVFKYCCTACA